MKSLSALLRAPCTLTFLLLQSLALPACSDDPSDDQPTQCCAVQRFCNSCSTCDSSDTTIAGSNDATACKQVVDHFIDVGRYCNPGNRDPRHDIQEFVAQCASR